MPKTANAEKVEMQTTRKLIKVTTVSVPAFKSSEEMRKKYKEKHG